MEINRDPCDDGDDIIYPTDRLDPPTDTAVSKQSFRGLVLQWRIIDMSSRRGLPRHFQQNTTTLCTEQSTVIFVMRERPKENVDTLSVVISRQNPGAHHHAMRGQVNGIYTSNASIPRRHTATHRHTCSRKQCTDQGRLRAYIACAKRMEVSGVSDVELWLLSVALT